MVDKVTKSAPGPSDLKVSELAKLSSLGTEAEIARARAAFEEEKKSARKSAQSKKKKELEKKRLKEAEKKAADAQKAVATLQARRQKLIEDIAKGKTGFAAEEVYRNELDKVDQKLNQANSNLKTAQDKYNSLSGQANRPSNVPGGATFSAVTGQWTLGNKKWDSTGKSITTPEAKKPSGEKAKTPGAGEGTPVPEGFSPGSFRLAEAKAEGVVPSTTATAPVVGTDFEAVLRQAQSQFGGIDELFKTNDELRKLLVKAVGDPNKVGDEYTVDRFVSELSNTNWFKTNAGPIRQRGFYKRQYDSLVKGLKTDDPEYKRKIEELNRTSEYGRGLQDTVDTVNEYVTQLLGVNALDDTTIRAIAENIYDYANEDDAVKIRNAVLGSAKYGKGAVIGGQAAETMSTLKAIAGANGFDLEKQFATDLPTWIDRISKGESIETYKKIIRDSAKTAFNVSDRVSALMDQGVNLDTIYTPYKNAMATVLEINPETVSLKDLSDKGVFGAKQEMNLYDFQRALRKDPRWQYTQNARDDMSRTALNLLRNFGFQG